MPSPAEPRAGQAVSSPLQPADTFSPRASLENFLYNMDRLVELWRADAPAAVQEPHLRAAVESFYFEALPYASSNEEQITRMLMAREILARVPLPTADRVPGLAEMRASGIEHWIVPGTDMRMIRVTSGPHAGEFKFGPTTIEALEATYRYVQSMPRLDGQPDAYQRYRERAAEISLTEEATAIRLHGVRTVSPRDTLNAFLENMNAAYDLALTAERALDAEPPLISIQGARQAQDLAADHLQQAASVFDLSEVPDILRYDTGIESALLLKEILDRIPLPRFDTVPNAAQMGNLAPGEAFRWRLPGTQIEIQRMLDGPQAGNFLFDADSVSLLRGNYEALRDYDYRSDAVLTLSGFHAAQVTPGFYDHYITTPGYLVPSTHFIGNLVEYLPTWSQIVLLDQTLWQWGGLILTLLALLLVCWGVFALVDLPRQSRPESVLLAWAAIGAPLVSAYLTRRAVLFVDFQINFTGDELGYLLFVAGMLELAFYVWAVWRFSWAVSSTILASPGMSQRGFDSSLIKLLSGILGVAFSIGVASYGLGRLGVDIVPLLAGLGVGGLAVALAIRPTLENLIGGLILFSDKPVRVGDFCTFGGMSGTVEDVGIRSTQIRAKDRTLISVPNAKFVDMEIINWARCDKMLIEGGLGLRYETSDDQLRYVLVAIREMLHAHPRIDETTIRVRFAGYDDSALHVAYRLYALTRDWNEFHAIREDVLLHMKRIVEASGTGFAFPSRTVYMAQDDGLDAERSSQTEDIVADWRNAGTLAFPRLTPDRVDALRGTLDYPPEGSSEHAQSQARREQQAEPLSGPPEK